MRGLPGWAKWTIGILIALGILLAAVFLWLHALLGKIQRVDREDTSFLPREEETFETDDDSGPAEDTVRPEDIDWSDVDVSVMQDDDVKNILLIGQDAREGEGRSRSDTMIICSLNRKTGKIILTSVMRDMYVPIPGYSDNRINAAYQLGGMALLDQVMEESLGISVDGNIEVNFQGFISAFSEIGSLDIELTEGEARYLNSNPAYLRQMGISTEGWNLKPGVNALTAEQALAYSRIRYVGNSDWERTDRQRKVLAAAFSKLRSSGIGTLLRLADRIFPHLTTDMDNAQLLGYVYSVVSSGMELDGSYRIPAEGTYTNETLRAGMEVLIPDLNANSRYLQEWIYG